MAEDRDAAEHDDDVGASPPIASDDDADRGVRALVASGRERFAAERARADALLTRHRERPLVDVAVRIYLRDRESAGPVVGSAIAFRLFLFFVPFLLFLVGLAGFLTTAIDEGDLADNGISGNLAAQMSSALTQRNSTRWVAVLIGLVGMATTGRTLSKVMTQASCLAWRLPMRKKASVRVIGAFVGLIIGMGLVTIVVNRIRHQLGLGATSVSLLAAVVVYAVLWLAVSSLLPRPTSDPGALLPGAVLVGATLVGMQAISQLYLPGRISRASELYGTIGATIVGLGWFFIAGRTIVVAMALNAAIHERFGSISRVVFALPLLRALPRRSEWFRRTFDLEP